MEHSDRHSDDFWQGTRDHDVRQNIAALLRYIEGEPPFALQDFGCGLGRDLKAFTELVHIAVGLEGAAHLAAIVRAHNCGEVWQQDFLKLDLPDKRFDDAFANAALFHVPSQELPRVLLQLHATLKPHGVLFDLDRQRRMDRTNGARENRQHTVAGGIDDAAIVRRGVLSKHLPGRFEGGDGGPFVSLHEPGITGNVRRKNGDQSLINVQVRCMGNLDTSELLLLACEGRSGSRRCADRPLRTPNFAATRCALRRTCGKPGLR